MGNKKYSDAQIMWLESNAAARVWKNRKELLDKFNETFNSSITTYQFNNLVLYYNIRIMTRQTESIFTKEQKSWLIENAKSGLFKNCEELTKTYNAIFNQHRDKDNIYSYLYAWGVSLVTRYSSCKYTDEMDDWLIKNFSVYITYDELASKFNEQFKVKKTAASIAHRCTRSLGLKRPSSRFKRGSSQNAKPVGTISYRKDGPYIKLNDSNDKTSWVPLKKVIYENQIGEIPDGYCVVVLDGNQENLDVSNLYCMDRRGTPVMASRGWWTDVAKFTKTGACWCNLYYIAKDYGVM